MRSNNYPLGSFEHYLFERAAMLNHPLTDADIEFVAEQTRRRVASSSKLDTTTLMSGGRVATEVYR